MESPTEVVVDTGLEERLQNHARAFESLLALTPARDYYGSQIVDGQDPSEQWNRKKQTKEQKRAAKKLKLDPANQKSALDVMKERELKRKRELGMDDEEDEEEQHRIGQAGSSSKRPKTEAEKEAAQARKQEKSEKRKQKRKEKVEKKAQNRAKATGREAGSAPQDESVEGPSMDNAKEAHNEVDDVLDPKHDEDLEEFDASGLAEPQSHPDDVLDGEDASSVPSSPDVGSPAFDVSTNHSTASSSSSIVPPSKPDSVEDIEGLSNNLTKPRINTAIEEGSIAANSANSKQAPSGTSSPKIQLPNIDQAELQERLRARIEELRARRKADGPDGRPARSRQELLEQRRAKEEQRKAAKKEQRRKQKEEEQRKQEAQLNGSGSPLSGDVFSTRSPQTHENSFSFSRLAFEDGAATDASLTHLSDPKKQKGRSDPKTALEAAQKKQARLAGYDDTKRADIAEKDLWLSAKKRAHGERVRDDTSLLKKALKRQEKQKGKSERQWQEREQAVVKGKEMKQQKREANLAKRRDEKGGKGKKKAGGAKGGKKKGRPGFEGRFKA